VSLLLLLLSLPTKHRPNIRRSRPIIQRLILPTRVYPQLTNPSPILLREGFLSTPFYRPKPKSLTTIPAIHMPFSQPCRHRRVELRFSRLAYSHDKRAVTAAKSLASMMVNDLWEGWCDHGPNTFTSSLPSIHF